VEDVATNQPLDTREALQCRLAMASPTAQTRGLFFEANVAELATLLGPEVAREARAVTSTHEWVESFQYPVTDLLRILHLGASTAEQRGLLTYAQALERFGAGTACHYLDTQMGKTFTALYTNKDIRQALIGSPTTARFSSLYAERIYQSLGPTSAQLLFRNEVMGPEWIRGFYRHGYQQMFNPRLSISVEDVRDCGLNFALLYDWGEGSEYYSTARSSRCTASSR
jgi:uncharacterized protein (TIGR02265 family)